MSNLVKLRLNSKKPILCVPCEGETVGDICFRCEDIMKKPHDIIEFKAGSFAGLPNLSQLWNAILMIQSVTNEEPVIFSCDMKKLPEYYQTVRDYYDILSFAIRCGLCDALEIESATDMDTIEDLCDQCDDTGLIPIVTLHLDTPVSASELATKLEPFTDIDSLNAFHLICPVTSKEELDLLQDSATEFMNDNFGYRIIIEPTGAIAKEELKKGNTFFSPIVYAEVDGETDELPSCEQLHAILKEKEEK